MNLYAALAEQFPRDKTACAVETESGLYYSWSDLDQASAVLANLLGSLSLSPGARVAVQVNKSVEAMLLYLATLRAGLVFLPLNNAYQSSEIEYFLSNASPEVVVCTPKNEAWFAPIAKAQGVKALFTLGDDRRGTLLSTAMTLAKKLGAKARRFDPVIREPGDLAAILYTSGTTGRSKGAMLSHQNLLSNAKTLKAFWGWEHGDVLLHALPIFHVHGLFVALHGALINGSKMIWLNKFDPAVVLKHLPRSTVFMGVPTMYVRLLDEAKFDRKAARNMRLFVSGSAPLLTDTFKAFEERIGRRILERYGMSETVMLTSNPYAAERRAGTVGFALPEVHVRVSANGVVVSQGETGDIEVKGPNVFSAYWQMPEKTKEEFTDDGFFKTGDVGRFDAEGYLSIVGRSKDLIITGGYNVYPKEIEALLDDLPEVQESAVIGVPHRDFGEAVTALVVLRPGTSIDESALISSLKGRIASFKVPKRIHVLVELPRNAMGKVQKNLLRQQFV